VLQVCLSESAILQSMPTVQTAPQKLLKVSDVAERLQVSQWSVYRRIAGGELAALRIGSGPRAPLRIEADALDALLQPTSTTKETT